jgi:uncharacterized Zn finger protein
MSDDTVEFEMPDYAPLTLDDVSETVLAKALRLKVTLTVTEESGQAAAQVIGSAGDVYDVSLGINEESLPVWALCSCPWGRRNQSGAMGCSHAVAAYMKYLEEGA